jgi:hypothetical protein
MAKNEEKLTGMLSSTPIKKGKGLQLSTNAQSQQRINAQSHTRVNRGYKLREDLIKACKQIALDTNRNLYEVMEAALSEYIERQKATSNDNAQSH